MKAAETQTESSMMVNPGKQGRNWSGDANANCRSKLCHFLTFKHQIACITMYSSKKLTNPITLTTYSLQ